MAGHSSTSSIVSATFENTEGFGIASVEPLQEAPGSFLTIGGSGFDLPSSVTVGGAEAAIVRATTSTILAVVPQVSGVVDVTAHRNDGQTATSFERFSVLQKLDLARLKIDTFDPEKQRPVFIVKLREGLQVRARSGTWVSDGIDDVIGLLDLIDGLGVDRIEPRAPWSDQRSAELHAKAEAFWNSDEVDLRLMYKVFVKPGIDPTMLNFQVQFTHKSRKIDRNPRNPVTGR
ncbi:MAG: IPT/TIG domain-containing protein [Deltaproteobacteria bacterium]|nr:IPT/TIG domain-containing protein [Deltaproteobacteria bacterium]